MCVQCHASYSSPNLLSIIPILGTVCTVGRNREGRERHRETSMSQYRLTRGSCIQGNVHCLFLVRRHIQTQYAPQQDSNEKNAWRSRKNACFGKSSEQTSHRPSDATIKTLAEFCEFRPAQRPQEPPAAGPCAFDPG